MRAAGGTQVAAGCAHLQEANHLLRDAGHPPLSPVLEQEIEQALEKYKPACTLEHLKVPAAAVKPLCVTCMSLHLSLGQFYLCIEYLAWTMQHSGHQVNSHTPLTCA